MIKKHQKEYIAPWEKAFDKVLSLGKFAP